MKHVMVDIECLGNTPPGVILSVGAVEFNAAGLGKEFYMRVDIGSSVLNGFNIEEKTVQWWREQSLEARTAAFYCGGAHCIETVLAHFAQFVNKSTFVWAKGPDYDCVMLAEAYKRLGLELPWSFRNNRDVRTILALSGVRQAKHAEAHNALADAKGQAIAVIDAYLALGKKFEGDTMFRDEEARR